MKLGRCSLAGKTQPDHQLVTKHGRLTQLVSGGVDPRQRWPFGGPWLRIGHPASKPLAWDGVMALNTLKPIGKTKTSRQSSPTSRRTDVVTRRMFVEWRPLASARKLQVAGFGGKYTSAVASGLPLSMRLV